MPRFMMFVRANSSTESKKPTADELMVMGAYNASLVAAGVLESAEGLHTSSRDSRRIAFHTSEAPTVQAGPFPANELVSGWWFLKVKDVDEAVEWAKKVPFKEGEVVEIRRIAEMSDFGEEFTSELRDKEEEMRKKIEAKAQGEGE